MIDIEKLRKNKNIIVTLYGKEYEIKLKNDTDLNPVVAFINSDNTVGYYISDLYNYGYCYAKIDLNKLNKLRKIIEGK